MTKKEDRNRQYFLTVFESAECFSNLDLIIQSQTNCTYAYIEHNKDVEETGEPKTKHFHIVLNYKNDRTFETIQNTFKGAHIEKVQILSKSVQYLTHKNDKEKHQYKFESIITNDLENIKALYVEKDFPTLNEQVIIEEIAKATKSNLNREDILVYFYMTYGNKQTKEYRGMILDLVNNLNATLRYKELSDFVDF